MGRRVAALALSGHRVHNMAGSHSQAGSYERRKDDAFSSLGASNELQEVASTSPQAGR
jgi:hypothetical protein